MPEQNFLAPGPKQSEFNALNSTVTSLSEQIAIKNFGSLNSMNDLKTALNNLAQSSGDFSIVYFKFYPNFTDSDAGFYADSYGERIGYVNVRQSSRFNAIITYQNGTVTRMANNNGTWKVGTVVTSEQMVQKEITVSQAYSTSSGWVTDFLGLPTVTTGRAILQYNNFSLGGNGTIIKRSSDQKVSVSDNIGNGNILYISGICK